MNNIFNNDHYYPYGTSVGSAYPTQAAPQPKFTQPLTEEEQKELMRTSVPFTTQIERRDLLKSFCTHRRGKDTTLVPNSDGSFTCSICGTTMTLEDYTEDDGEEISAKAINYLNNIKVKFYDIPDDIVKEIMQIIPYIERLPKLYKLANENFGRYTGYNQNINPALASPYYGVWNNFDMMHGGYGYGYPAYGQPMMNQPQTPVQPPVYGGYPAYPDPTMQYGQPMSTMGLQQNQMVMGGNPLYAQPTQPMMNQPQTPVQQTVPNNAQPTQPVPQQADTVTTTATVAL